MVSRADLTTLPTLKMPSNSSLLCMVNASLSLGRYWRIGPEHRSPVSLPRIYCCRESDQWVHSMFSMFQLQSCQSCTPPREPRTMSVHVHVQFTYATAISSTTQFRYSSGGLPPLPEAVASADDLGIRSTLTFWGGGSPRARRADRDIRRHAGELPARGERTSEGACGRADQFSRSIPTSAKDGAPIRDAKITLVSHDAEGVPTYQVKALNTPSTQEEYVGNLVIKSAGAWSIHIEVVTEGLGTEVFVAPISVAPAAVGSTPEAGLMMLLVMVAFVLGGGFLWLSSRRALARRASSQPKA